MAAEGNYFRCSGRSCDWNVQLEAVRGIYGCGKVPRLDIFFYQMTILWCYVMDLVNKMRIFLRIIICLIFRIDFISDDSFISWEIIILGKYIINEKCIVTTA